MEDNDWETIQPSTSTSTTHSDEDDGDSVIIATPTLTHTNFHNPQISTPTNHDSPPISSQQPLPETPSPTSSCSSTSTPYSTGEAKNKLLNTSLRILSSWVLKIAYGVRTRIGLWSLASAMTVIAYAMRWQRRRRMAEKDNMDRLLLLINQKDEKIKQLLVQIDRLNETLSARRMVPVFRVVVDSPFVIGPRSTWKLT